MRSWNIKLPMVTWKEMNILGTDRHHPMKLDLIASILINLLNYSLTGLENTNTMSTPILQLLPVQINTVQSVDKSTRVFLLLLQEDIPIIFVLLYVTQCNC